MKNFLIFILLFLSINIDLCFPKEIGIFGNVYPIKEKNPIEEIKQAIDNKSKIIKEKLTKIKDNALKLAEKKIYHLPSVQINKAVVLDTTYVLPRDIVIYDKNGNPYVYKKGTKFDILKLFSFFPVYIVFNPNNEKELNFVKKYISIKKNKYKDIRLLITEIPQHELKLNKKIMILTERIAKLFKLKGTIAIIKKEKVKIGDTQKNKLVVRYYSIKR